MEANHALNTVDSDKSNSWNKLLILLVNLERRKILQKELIFSVK